MAKDSRLSKQQLLRINDRLSERDRLILTSINRYRYLTTRQIYELYFTDSSSQLAAHRAANRTLAKLREFGLLTTLNRRIGGVRAGSSSYVWGLDTAGYRLLDTIDNAGEKPKRQRPFEPSIRFLEHTLAIAEVSVQLHLIAKKDNKIELSKEETEPYCWRLYTHESGALVYLKPDLYAVTFSADFEDYWFFEIDLATESPSRIINKCQQYLRYYRNGTEQRSHGVFPLVVWITLDKKRSEVIRHHIYEQLGAAHKEIFVVITPDQLETLICDGAAAINNGCDNAEDTAPDMPPNPDILDLKTSENRGKLLSDDCSNEDGRHDG